MQTKSSTNCDAHLAESLFQTCSGETEINFLYGGKNESKNTAFRSFRVQTSDPLHDPVNPDDDLYINLRCS
ncbi:DUF6783 domain-containing protein [Blautia sp.]